MRRAGIRWLSTTTKSIEEIAATLIQTIKLDKLTDADLALRWLKGTPDRVRDAAAELGTDVHDEAERLVLQQAREGARLYIASGVLPTWDDRLAPHMASFTRFLEDWHPEYLATELTVFNRTQGYAGTLDAIMRITFPDGRSLVVLVDYKSGRAIYPEVALQLASYARVDNRQYRLLKLGTPGPYTFILEATKEVPRRLSHPSRRTIGLRVPDHPVALALLAELNEPLLTTTLQLLGDEAPLTEGWEIQDRLDDQIELILDAGHCGTEPTTIIDLTASTPELIRAGLDRLVQGLPVGVVAPPRFGLQRVAVGVVVLADALVGEPVLQPVLSTLPVGIEAVAVLLVDRIADALALGVEVCRADLALHRLSRIEARLQVHAGLDLARGVHLPLHALPLVETALDGPLRPQRALHALPLVEAGLLARHAAEARLDRP